MPLELLTERRVQTATPDDTQERLELRDTKIRGLELRIGKREGSRRWALIYTRRSDSRVRRVTLGRYPELSLADARRKAMKLKAEIEEGRDPASAIQIQRTAPTFAELAEQWVELHGKPNKDPKSLSDNISMLKVHVHPIIGTMKVEKITKREIIHLLDLVALRPDGRFKKPQKKKPSKRKVLDAPVLNQKRKLSHRPNRVFELVRSIFRWGISRDIIATDPTHGMKAPVKKERPRERVLTTLEIQQFWNRLEDAPISLGLQLALRLALITAQRIGEVAGIAKSELDLESSMPLWNLPADRSKNREGHRIPLSPFAVELIKEAWALSEDSDYLFPSPKGVTAIGSHAATKAMMRARPVLGLDDFRVHDLRRTAATGMALLGISPHTISLVLNHVSARTGTITTAVYIKYSYDAEKRVALDAWGEHLAEMVRDD